MHKKWSGRRCDFKAKIHGYTLILHDKLTKRTSVGAISKNYETGNNPMVGMTVSVAVAVEEALK